MYKLKEGMNLPKEFKIKVNPEQSEALQLHLFTIGYSWAGEKIIQYAKSKYIYAESKYLLYGMDNYNFEANTTKEIRFKDYFEKGTNQFPEKWCIEVTEDNCKELNIWMHRNWKNYPEYTDRWKVCYIGEYFYSHPIMLGCCMAKKIYHNYTIITTQQFREKFGIVNINET